ncbi:MAG: pyridoxal phosphate-dependent aminotransferase [candidate division Zixibacteria bacterium]|nr:pyridoxal phosphate-dependent aminotransferase [candidate division Zixibacteria bacterium]
MNHKLDDIVFEGIVSIRDRLLTMPDPLRLESGDPSFDTPVHIKEALAKALRDNATHYAPSTGIKPLREAIINKLRSDNKISYLSGPDNVVVTNGGMHALYCTFQALLNPGDEVIYPQPNWTATGWIIKLCGGELVKVPLRAENGYVWDPAEVESSISPRTKAILVNSPHNPTGGIFKRKDIVALLDIAAKHNLYVVSDEAYEHIIYDELHVSAGSIASDYPQTVRDKIVTCFTFSKSYAMTGWRLGYAVCSDQRLIDQMKKIILYSINGVSTPTQHAGIVALNGPQECVAEMRDEYKTRRDILFQGVNQTDFLKCETPPGGAFYLYARITDSWPGTPWELVNYLIENYSLGSVPGDIFYDEQPSIRFAYACSTEMIERAIRVLSHPRSQPAGRA